MTLSAHLTDEQFTRYRERSLSASELLDVDGHIAACAACRDRLYAENRAFAGMRGLLVDLSAHLEYADIVACSEGRGNPQQLAHIRSCVTCQSEVQDLSRFRTELAETRRKPVVMPTKRRGSYRIPIGIAAAVLVIGVSSTIVFRRPKPAPTPTAATAPPQRVDPLLPSAERQILAAAVSSGRLERPPVLDALISKQGTLLSPSQEKERFNLLAPVGTTVLSDRPMLRWTMLASANSYVVSIFDEKFQKVAESPALTTTEWHPPAPLPRGKVLSWQVTARTATGTVRQPAPPAPEARFQVVEPEVVERIEKMRRDSPGNPLLLAALYAHAGALDEAEALLRAMDSSAAQSYREALQKVRKGE
jgi:hypothetical protein